MSKRLIASVLTVSIVGCTSPARPPEIGHESALCIAECPSPADVFLGDGSSPTELVTSYWDTDATACVYLTDYGEYVQHVLCAPEVEEPITTLLGELGCEDCGCADGICPITDTTVVTDGTAPTDGDGTADPTDPTDPGTDTTMQPTLGTSDDTVVVHNVVGDFFKLLGALGKVAGVAKLACVIKAAIKAAKTAVTALTHARANMTILKGLLQTYPVGSRTPAVITQIQNEAWRASANYARSLAAARLSLKKSAEAVGIITAAIAGGNYLLGSKEADEAAKKEIEDGMKDAETTLTGVEGDVIKNPVDAGDPNLNNNVTPRSRFNRAIREMQKIIDELTAKKMKEGKLCDDEQALLDIAIAEKDRLVKERDALPGAK